MKLIAFWVLVLLAVLVPAAAVVASATTSPASTELRHQSVQGTVVQHASGFGLHAKLAKSKAKARSAKQGAADLQGDHCCDLTPCSQCSGCGTCASMALNTDVETQAGPIPLSLLSESRVPRAEFLLSGQERPPRAS